VLICARVIVSVFIGFFCFSAVSPAFAQAGADANKKQDQSKTGPAEGAAESTQPADTASAEEPPIYVYLVSGGRLQVDEVRETADGVWYKQSGLMTLLDRKRVARIERPSDKTNARLAPAGQDFANWTITDSAKVEKFFLGRFGRPLPISALGQSDLHNRWGLDHRQGLDVGLHPDSVEGVVLVEFLRSQKIPFLTFRGAIPGVATGPHIHIGKASHRVTPTRKSL